MARWTKRTLPLPNPEAWRCKDGYQIFIADRGALRFDFPSDWIVTPGSVSIEFRDPGDDCVLEASCIRLPPIDWSGLPLVGLLLRARQEEGVSVGEEDLVQLRRTDLELVWHENRFIDPNERREAISRMCMARGQNVQALITFAYWPEDASWCEPVWDEVLRSLQLGIEIPDPTQKRVH